MNVYYNENDPYAAEWLRNLVAAGEIPNGDVDERSIMDVRPEDLEGYGQCHFFAGIGGWPLALRLAGWPEDRPVWTGSVPCQPLSSAGQRKGHADERHLWPAFQSLIAKCRPPTILGEQVASKDGREWFSGVRADLEALGYACGAADLCAAGVGAPQIRQRVWWVADADGGNTSAEGIQRGGQYRQQPQDSGLARGLGHTTEPRRTGSEDAGTDSHDAGEGCGGGQPERTGDLGGVGEPALPEGARQSTQQEQLSGPANFWSAHDLIPCGDGKSRRVEPGTFPLAHGVPARVGRLRAYGNAIVPQVAAEFIKAYMEAER